jgi:hypothetical protein
MLPIISKPAISMRQKVAALAVAGCADVLQIVLWPVFFEGGVSPFDDALDVIVATVLIGICGFRWQFILAFLMETVPGLDLFPTWTALALTLQTAPHDPPRFEVLPPPANGDSASTRPPIHVDAVAVPPVRSASGRV